MFKTVLNTVLYLISSRYFFRRILHNTARFTCGRIFNDDFNTNSLGSLPANVCTFHLVVLYEHFICKLQCTCL